MVGQSRWEVTMPASAFRFVRAIIISAAITGALLYFFPGIFHPPLVY
jgi:hypothetical protein